MYIIVLLIFRVFCCFLTGLSRCFLFVNNILNKNTIKQHLLLLIICLLCYTTWKKTLLCISKFFSCKGHQRIWFTNEISDCLWARRTVLLLNHTLFKNKVNCNIMIFHRFLILHNLDQMNFANDRKYII